jgi:poly-gamma-glutamate synthase PgsB/CapB
MAFPFAVFATATLAAAGIFESVSHEKRLKRMPIRILVNGTRGKSTVTRLIAAGLRACDVRTLAKTTGSAARLILPDGSEEPIRRRGPVRITEQIGVTKRAVKLDAKALVVECMAIEPENQRVLEQRLVRSTIGVLTNVRLDHRDAMGDTEQEIAAALASTIPAKATFISCEGKFDDYFGEECKRRGSGFLSIDPASISREELEGFSYPMFAENLALAIGVCESLGLDRARALEGMRESKPDPGVNPIRHIQWRGVSVVIVDAFAANDPESTKLLWDRFAGRLARVVSRKVILVNHRADRPFRILEMKDFCRDVSASRVIFCGALDGLASRAQKRGGTGNWGDRKDNGAMGGRNDMSGKAAEKRVFQERDPAAILDIAVGGAAKGAEVLLFLAGNIKGDGARFLEFISGFGEDAGK